MFYVIPSFLAGNIPMHDQMQANQQTLTQNDLGRIARGNGFRHLGCRRTPSAGLYYTV